MVGFKVWPLLVNARVVFLEIFSFHILPSFLIVLLILNDYHHLDIFIVPLVSCGCFWLQFLFVLSLLQNSFFDGENRREGRRATVGDFKNDIHFLCIFIFERHSISWIVSVSVGAHNAATAETSHFAYHRITKQTTLKWFIDLFASRCTFFIWAY